MSRYTKQHVILRQRRIMIRLQCTMGPLAGLPSPWLHMSISAWRFCASSLVDCQRINQDKHQIVRQRHFPGASGMKGTSANNISGGDDVSGQWRPCSHGESPSSWPRRRKIYMRHKHCNWAWHSATIEQVEPGPDRIEQVILGPHVSLFVEERVTLKRPTFWLPCLSDSFNIF